MSCKRRLDSWRSPDVERANHFKTVVILGSTHTWSYWGVANAIYTTWHFLFNSSFFSVLSPILIASVFQDVVRWRSGYLYLVWVLYVSAIFLFFAFGTYLRLLAWRKTSFLHCLSSPYLNVTVLLTTAFPDLKKNSILLYFLLSSLHPPPFPKHTPLYALNFSNARILNSHNLSPVYLAVENTVIPDLFRGCWKARTRTIRRLGLEHGGVCIGLQSPTAIWIQGHTPSPLPSPSS